MPFQAPEPLLPKTVNSYIMVTAPSWWPLSFHGFWSILKPPWCAALSSGPRPLDRTLQGGMGSRPDPCYGPSTHQLNSGASRAQPALKTALSAMMEYPLGPTVATSHTVPPTHVETLKYSYAREEPNS